MPSLLINPDRPSSQVGRSWKAYVWWRTEVTLGGGMSSECRAFFSSGCRHVFREGRMRPCAWGPTWGSCPQALLGNSRNGSLGARWTRGEVSVARALIHLTGISASLHLGAWITDSHPLGRGPCVRLFCHLTRTSTLLPVLVTQLPEGPFRRPVDWCWPSLCKTSESSRNL